MIPLILLKFLPLPIRFRSIGTHGNPLARWTVICGLLAFSHPLSAASPPDIAFFEKHIRPVLVEQCYQCHSAGAKKLKAGLRLDYQGGWEKGGESGPALVPGKPEESRLLEAIRYHNPDLEMPPKGALSPEVVAHFEEWIRRGAPDPRDDGGPPVVASSQGINLEEGRRFWSFLPRRQGKPPAVENEGWPRDPIDHFILARLDQEKLKPSADTTAHTLLRRLHLDLTGLPPTTDEITRFLSHFQKAPRAAVETKVDQLLSDPAFGERWGRHWLDLARYADSTGGGRAIPLPNAWRYRDYVIQAFTEDRPLNQIIREQIAGDLLPSDSTTRIRNLVATGFLLLGPHNYENQDKELLELEIIDEQLDTIGRSFLGMTIGCARCHDHKFDPIPTSDYYAMAGIFMSTTFVKHSNVSSWNKEPLPLAPEKEKLKKSLEQQIGMLNKQLKGSKAELQSLEPQKNNPPKFVGRIDLPGITLDNRSAELVGEWMRSQSSPRWVGEEYIHDKSEKKTEKTATFRPMIPKAGRYEVRLSYSAGSNRPKATPVTITHAQGQTTVLVNQQKKPNHDTLFHTLGTFEFAKGQSTVRISNEGTKGAVIVDALQLLPEGFTLPESKRKEPGKPDPKRDALVRELKKTISGQEKTLKELRGKIPKAGVLMAVKDGKAADTKVRLRGMARNFGERVPRGVLQVALPKNTSFQIKSGSGRLELADWIASPDNPLTARVLANRIWRHLFGHGLVRTPDNFGVSGELPSHPGLLDHLAQRLIDEGWSPKKLIRAIVLSRTYQLSSTPGRRARKLDPQNRLLSHLHRRSIDAEVMRDSILQLAGMLDRSQGGPSLPPNFKSEFGFKFNSPRRSVYIPVFRNTLYEVFATFDFANPNFTVGHRTTSTIPTQPLFLSNSPFVHTHAAAAAGELLKLAAQDDPERIQQAFLRTFTRPPSPEELALSLDFVQQSGGKRAAWEALQRALFLTVDFRYLP
jgi:hypothetical protein